MTQLDDGNSGTNCTNETENSNRIQHLILSRLGHVRGEGKKEKRVNNMIGLSSLRAINQVVLDNVGPLLCINYLTLRLLERDRFPSTS
jgi:hypothetical protein